MQLYFFITLTQTITYSNHVKELTRASIWQVHFCCTLPSANDYTYHLQDATIVELAIKQFY